MTEDAKLKILDEAETLFLRYGFKSITMDDVARELGISKKTLYLHFTDKQDLVDQCVENYLARVQDVCTRAVNDKDDAIAIILDITTFISSMLKSVSHSSMYDLKKYFKSAWDKLEVNRKEFIYNSIQNNLELGIRKGLYRKDISIDHVSKIYVHLIGYLMDPENYYKEEIDLREMHLEIIKYHLYAVCTPKGQDVLHDKLKHFNKK